MVDMPRNATPVTEAERALISRYAGSAPRYTSYPTAPHFDATVSRDLYGQWLERLPAGSEVSLYVHIPYCGTLCWFCACRTQGVRSRAPIARYLDTLGQEIAAVAARAPGLRARRIHWGGGSPTILTADEIRALARTIDAAFPRAETYEFAVEIDPRDMTDDRIEALADAGVTRASLGVQDFDPDVQRAINRLQGFEDTRRVIDGLRARGVASVNVDALYGLPRQTLARSGATLDRVIDLAPDRVALFGYAHVPWMSKRQQLILQDDLPDSDARFAQAKAAGDALSDAGYARIGLDHFAKPADEMAIAAQEGRLRRNFQGYTTDDGVALIGFGASAIGRMPQGYVQNAAATAAYLEAVSGHGLATARGKALSLDDRMRGDAIEGLMCAMRFDGATLIERYGDLARPVVALADRVFRATPEALWRATPRGYAVNELGRPFLRSIAQGFDAYAGASDARYSRAV